MRYQSEGLYWILGGPVAGSLAGAINSEPAYCFLNVEVEEKIYFGGSR
jgi:hypothetical protein